MAFENVGIGGVLRFDHKQAVTNMGVASRAFGALETAASKASAGIGRIGRGMGAFSLMGGLGVAGLVEGFKHLVETGKEWDAYVESTKISIGTIMAAVTKTPLADNIANADKILQHLNIVATQTHVETSEVVDTFSRLVGPLLGAGASMKDIYDYTKGTTIMASALHQPVNRAAHAMSLMAGGTLMAREQTVQLLHSMGLLHETSQEWAAYLPEKRLARMKEIMSTFAASGEYLQHTWAAQASSAKSFFKIMAGAFAKGMFDRGSDALAKFNAAFIEHQDEWLAKITAFGQVFNRIINFLSNEVKLFYNTITRVTAWVQDHLDYLGDDRLPGIGKAVAHIVSQFILLTTVISPVIAVVGFLVSKFIAIAEIAMGLGEVVMAIVAPLTLVLEIAAGLFLLFHKQGESVMDEFHRFLAYVEEIGARLYKPIQESIDTLVGAFEQAKAGALDFWQAIQPGLENLRGGVLSVVNIFVELWQGIEPIIVRIISGVVNIYSALEPGIAAVFNGVMKVVRAVIEGIEYLIPKIMGFIGPVIDVVVSIGEHVGSMLGRVLGALKPVFDAVAYIAQNVIFPVLGWIIDYAGPVIIEVFRAIGWVIGKAADIIGWIADKLGDVANFVGSILRPVFDGIFWIIGKIGDGIKFVADKLAWVGDKLGWVTDKAEALGSAVLGAAADAASYVGDKLGGAVDAVGGAISDVIGLLHTSNDATTNWAQTVYDQVEMAKLAALGVKGVIMLIAQELEEVYKKYAKPVIDAGIQIINSIVGDAKVDVKQPDVTVKNDQNFNMTMCVNGRNIATAQAQYQTEIGERSGYNKTPYQAQRVQVSGVDLKPVR